MRGKKGKVKISENCLPPGGVTDKTEYRTPASWAFPVSTEVLIN